MAFELGIVLNDQFLHFNQQNQAIARRNVGTALLQQGWNPAISTPGNNLFNHERFYEPVEESVHFQLFASGIDAPARIHRRILEIDRFMKRISYRDRAPEMPPAFMFYAVSGIAGTPNNYTVATSGNFVSPILSAQLILPEQYMRTIHLKMALDVEARIVRNGLWVDAAAYAYRNIRTSTTGTVRTPATFTITNFQNLSPYVNTLDVRVSGFKSVSGRYYLPRGYTIFHEADQAIAHQLNIGLLTYPASQFSTVSDGGVNITRYTPTTTGYVPFVSPGDSYPTIGTGSFPQLTGVSETYQMYLSVRTSGVNTTFAIQPMFVPFVSITGNTIESYGRETIISNILKPTPIYLGELKSHYRGAATMAFRVRRITGSGYLDFHSLVIVRDDKAQAVYHEFPQAVSGFLNASTNPIESFLNIEGNTMGSLYPADTTGKYGRGPYANDGASIRLSPTENQKPDTVASADDRAYSLFPFLGNHAMPFQFNTRFGFEDPTFEDTATMSIYDLGVTLLWCGGSTDQAWRFTYPSGIFHANVFANMAGLWPTVPRLQ